MILLGQDVMMVVDNERRKLLTEKSFENVCHFAMKCFGTKVIFERKFSMKMNLTLQIRREHDMFGI